MVEFWEEAFKNKQIMWGEQSTISAIETCKHFKSLGFQKILIPGFGYGRNARPFLDSGFEVTGIEISKTAIELAYQLLGGEIKVFHGSISDMPFDQDIYDGIFCHALIHLLKSDERKQLIANCNAQLKSGGVMVFTAITKNLSEKYLKKETRSDRTEIHNNPVPRSTSPCPRITQNQKAFIVCRASCGSC